MHARPSACIGCEGLNFSQSNQHHHDALHKVYVTLNRLPSCLQSWHARQLRAYFIWLRRDSRPCADLAREGSPLRRTKCVQLAHLHFTRYQRAGRTVHTQDAGASHHSLALTGSHSMLWRWVTFGNKPSIITQIAPLSRSNPSRGTVDVAPRWQFAARLNLQVATGADGLGLLGALLLLPMARASTTEENCATRRRTQPAAIAVGSHSGESMERASLL